MSRAFRCQLVLMVLGEYAFGDHVRDPQAFVRRCEVVLSQLPRRRSWLTTP